MACPITQGGRPITQGGHKLQNIITGLSSSTLTLRSRPTGLYCSHSLVTLRHCLAFQLPRKWQWQQSVRMLGSVKSVNRTLQLLRLKSDIATMFCSVRGFVDIDNCDSLFTVIDCDTSHTRGHNLRLFRDRCNLNVVVIGSRPSDHYFRSVCLFVCLFVCAEFFSAVFDPIWIKLGHMLHVRVQLCPLE